MLLRFLRVPKREFEAGTGWSSKPEGACRGEVCIPLSKPVDVKQLANDIARRVPPPK